MTVHPSDQDRAASLAGVARWRAVYHATNHDGRDHAGVVEWFAHTPEAATANAAALLPPPAYQRPHTVSIEPGTYQADPDGRWEWQPLGPGRLARVTATGLTIEAPGASDGIDQPTTQPAAAVASQQNLF